MQLEDDPKAVAPERVEQSAPESYTHREIMEILIGLLAALFTAIISSTIVSNALPTIIADLEGSQAQYTWVVTASLLAMTVSTPVWGKLSDLFNKKLLVQVSIIVFVIGSVFAGLSQNVPELIAMRVVQGIGMGGLTANAQSIIGSIIPPRERGRYSGYLGATMAVATVSGPLVGGVIVDTPGLGWRWTFYVCVPLALVSLVMLQKHLHIATIRRRVQVDYLGIVLIAIAASLPLLWVSFAGDSFAWMSWQSAAFVVGTILAWVLTVRVELRHPEPMVPIGVIRERTTALAIIGSIAVGVAIFGGSVFIGQYFQVAGARTPTQAGLLTIPLMLGSLVGTLLSGRLITKTGFWKRFLVLGSVLLIIGLALLATIDHRTPEWHAMVFLGFVGLGMGMLMQNYVLVVQNTVDVSQVGATSAVVAFFRSLGGAVGVSVLGAILAAQVKDDVTSKLAALGPAASSAGGGSLLDVKNLPPQVAEIVREAYGDATGTIFLVAACISVVSLVTALLMKEVPLRTTLHKTDDVDANA
ncbi:MDR family MFS transporter [Aeromicrobium wangtongii]|uniref:MFS transporter n=1 Tax=Aeromicrobium wangtongii TaxID=2969247 RepID=A0ABY5M806_9ACTN|nr:MDR family MFS transporter [Aeromicrobium wangtongii]MCD9196775.1 MFS transporter [Aeromicrobium wangtongii]UUP14285.1 MFS transporter [Aeromicrobium wangtongii]